MNDLFPFLTPDILTNVVKIVLVLLIGLYAIFVFVIFFHVRSLRKALQIKNAAGSSLVQNLALFYFVAAISLFFISLVIL